MKLTNVDPNLLIQDLEAQRKAVRLSYQNVADACEVSQATIMRTLKGQAEPTLDLLQKIAAAVSYDQKPAPVVLQGYTQEDYIKYLHQLVERRDEEYKIREAKAEARNNMIISQKSRTIRWLCGIIALLAVTFILWLILDVADFSLFV